MKFFSIPFFISIEIIDIAKDPLKDHELPFFFWRIATNMLAAVSAGLEEFGNPSFFLIS